MLQFKGKNTLKYILQEFQIITVMAWCINESTTSNQ